MTSSTNGAAVCESPAAASSFSMTRWRKSMHSLLSVQLPSGARFMGKVMAEACGQVVGISTTMPASIISCIFSMANLSSSSV